MELRKLIALIIIFWLAALCAACLLNSCQTSHVERFHGDKDSVNYYRNGSVEWSWRNR